MASPACRVKLHWPKAQAEAARARAANQALLQGCLREMHPSLATSCNTASLTQAGPRALSAGAGAGRLRA